LVIEGIEHCDGRLLAVQRAGRPFTDQVTRLEVVGGDGEINRVGGIGGCVQSDDIDALASRGLDRVVHARPVRRDQDAFVATGDSGLDGLDLPILVAVLGAGSFGQRHAVLGGGVFSALLHRDPERVVVVLGDQGDGAFAATAAATTL